jgi:nickel-dependent lactate racemase
MKNSVRVKIPFDKGAIGLELPRDRLLGILQKRPGPGKKIGRMFERSLAAPAAKSALKDALGRGGKRVLIVVPDSTRSAHLKDILTVLLKRIEGRASSVEIIVATGLHKKHSRGQIENILGKAIAGAVRVSSHSQDISNLERHGVTSLGIPIVLNKKLRECDCVMTVGVIEPHLYAGYSGGAKTIAIGLAGEETINATHSIRFLDHPGTAIDSVESNPFQKTLWEILGDIRVPFTVNCVNDSRGEAVAVFSGSVKDVFARGVRFAKDAFRVSVNAQSDIVVAGVGYPKDVNLYQASRAINYVLDAERPVLKKGGVLIVAAGLRDGTGGGITEKRFYGALSCISSPREFVEKTRRDGCIAGEHRAYMVARPMQHYNIILVTGANRPLWKKLPFPCFDNIQEAIIHAEKMVAKPAGIYVIPRALSTIACLNSE